MGQFFPVVNTIQVESGRLNQTMTEAMDQEGQPGLRDQEIGVAKMAEL